MEQLKLARNVAIVAAIAAGVYFLPGGGRAADTFEAVLLVAFGAGIAYLGVRLYRENRVALHGLGDHHRGLLYGALAAGVFLLTARQRMWHTGAGELVWFAAAALVVYALLMTYRYWRTY
jgi:TRAP-type C4-dicarboxylate transport system permease small subunit